MTDVSVQGLCRKRELERYTLFELLNRRTPHLSRAHRRVVDVKARKLRIQASLALLVRCSRKPPVQGARQSLLDPGLSTTGSTPHRRPILN